MKYKRLILLTIFAMVILLFSISTVSAIDNTTTNGINGAITWAVPGDTILLDSGNYTGTSNTGITITKNTTIQGNGPTNSVIIDAKGLSRIFTIDNNLNLTFLNGNVTGNRGAIWNNNALTMLTFVNCIFFNNNPIPRRCNLK